MTLRQQLLWTAIVAFAVGAGVDAFLRERVLLRHASTAVDVPLPAAEEPPTPIGTIGSDQRTADAAPSGRSRPGTDAAGAHALSLPIDGMDVERIKGGFSETRDAGGRPHAAADILAPRGTPVRAVDDGRIVKLFFSKQGGNTVYQFDPSERFCYYYAHLDRYAANVREGDVVRAGEVIGYVGTSGNAPPDTPHLHFAVFELTPAKHWWEGRAIDPYPLLRDGAANRTH